MKNTFLRGKRSQLLVDRCQYALHSPLLLRFSIVLRLLGEQNLLWLAQAADAVLISYSRERKRGYCRKSTSCSCLGQSTLFCTPSEKRSSKSATIPDSIKLSRTSKGNQSINRSTFNVFSAQILHFILPISCNPLL